MLWKKINGVYSTNILHKIKDVITNLNKYKSIGTLWIALYVKASQDVMYFDSSGVEHILKEIKNSHRKQKILWQVFIEYKHTIQ